MHRQKLNLGCGRDIRKDCINIDFKKLPGVDVEHNLNVFPYPFKDNTFSEVICNHVLESLVDLVKVMDELHRICKDSAIIKVYDVYYNCSSHPNDPYLLRTFNENSFNFLDKSYGIGFYSEKDFRIKKVELIPTRFGKVFPKFIRVKASKVLGEIFSNVYFEIEVKKSK